MELARSFQAFTRIGIASVTYCPYEFGVFSFKYFVERLSSNSEASKTDVECDLEVEVSSNASEQEESSDDDESAQTATLLAIYHRLYNNPSYSRILIGSLSVLKWRKVFRIKRIIYVSGQKEE